MDTEKQEEVVVAPQEEVTPKRGTLKGRITDWGVDVSALCKEIMDTEEI